ncbi:DUF2927 domain-containing protein [Tropicimonas sp. TH_r6]|uniref:DUF2927 domain-containing protein n=1 Tax=Tropicimonas sp. TH_r6 TaxID=3082085 RepID=UPI002953BE35|nr:DUF2927 domain-containing protein [Tropicimonas sp. TH_r6]MDV7142832.1 DUF2927 domain-containing protein [Tropicimonas sp. TH_r6]
MRAISLAALTLALAACAPGPSADISDRKASYGEPLPAMRSFTTASSTPSVRSNRQLAGDFLELTFELESGREIPRLTRFDGEITLELRGAAPQTVRRDLDRLIARLKREAGLPVRLAQPGETASIVVEVLPRKDLQRAVPQAACFVVPRVRGWDEFRKARRSDKVDWTTLQSREVASVFLPGDVSPQEARDCLHEEIAQALGPLNDLYRLPDSVFNDDNFHTVLTGFDMLMLRVTYDRALANGMGREQVAAALPGILARLNPRGERSGPPPSPPTPHIWVEAIENALGPRGTPGYRRAQARRAVDLARSAGWNDTRMAFSLYAYGRLTLNTAPDQALAAFVDASNIYTSLPDTQIQAAHVAMQLGAFSLSAGEANGTLRLVESNLPAVRQAENAALLSTLLMMRAEALELLGRSAEARTQRNEALGWARYGFGSDTLVRDRASEIAALAPVRTGL